MPEGAEVETLKRSVQQVLYGYKIRHVRLGHPNMLRRQPEGRNFETIVCGQHVSQVWRKGKYLGIDLSGGPNGENVHTILIHLGMSGWVHVENKTVKELAHTHMVLGWETQKGSWEMRLIDPRRFGWFGVFTQSEVGAIIGKLGPDGLDDHIDAVALIEKLKRRRSVIKTVLLDQSIIAGVGNIYADELLWASQISPKTRACDLDSEQISAIRTNVKKVLEAGVARRGTTLKDNSWKTTSGDTGGKVKALAVHGKEAWPCERCGEPIVREVLGGRSTYWCMRCQRVKTKTK